MLAGGAAYSIVEDGYGRVYVGTGRGVLRIDTARHLTSLFTPLDGLPHGSVRVAHAQRGGTLWFGTTDGVSRFVPGPPGEEPEPPIAVTAVQAAGEALPISELGVPEVPTFTLPPGQGQVEVEFVSVHSVPGQAVRYEYRLDGADEDWRGPSSERRLRFARLAPGRYRLEVRAVASGGRVSRHPATVSFVVLQPVWKRPWFVAAAALALGGAAYMGYRVRLAHLLSLERVRTRIATDLHDDVGSTVSRMAILSEVAKRQVEDTHAEAARVLEEIGTSARGLLDTTGDIVWAIDPRRDDGASLAARVREFGAGLLEARGIAWEFEASPEAEALKLDPEQRRQLLLIFKEALHNIVRHARCATAAVSIAASNGRLQAEIRDDGRGFADPTGNSSTGHGLDSMRARAARLGGELRIHSRPGTGTRLTLEVPLRRASA
jgi:signal transduction histidine kinase